jgi:hypothetical protein
MNEDLNMEVENKDSEKSEQPKYRQLIRMLTFRVVPAYYKEIEKVAAAKNITVSKLIRGYIKEGMIKDGELTKGQINKFKI